jgi:hypothetical protein
MMTSWRESDPDPVQPPKRKRSPKSPARATQKKSAWRGSQSGSPASASPGGNVSGGRDWLVENSSNEPMSRSAVKRWTAVAGLLVLLFSLTGFLIHQLFFRQPKLPLYTISVGDYPTLPEFRENPFGNSQRNRVAEINDNYVMPYAWEFDGNDNALSQFQFKTWQESLTEPPAMTKLGNSISAYYVSCFARVDTDSIQLFHQASEPFDREKSQSIDLQVLLENLARSVSDRKNHFVWVILDLQLPDSSTAFGWGDVAWKSATQSVLGRISPELVERLVVTLPAADGQNNWLSPEYSASFFGYHLFRLLDAPSENLSLWDRILGRAITFEEFKSKLGQAVSNDVANRRFALQQPVWLPEDSLQRVGSLGLVGGSRGSLKATSTTDIEFRLRQVRELWSQLDSGEFRDGYRWDPLGYARIESQLIALEQIALFQPDSFAEARDATEKEFGRMEKPVANYEVSLIEDLVRSDYFFPASRSAQRIGKDKIDSLLQEDPNPFVQQDQSPDQPVSSSLVEPGLLTEGEKYRLVWGSFLRGARGERARWQEIFSINRLQEAFEFLRLDSQAASMPLEIFLLQRLKDDLDWNDSSDPRLRAEACAKLLAAFDKLQTLGARPEPELTDWLSRQMEPIENQFLMGFDWLAIGNWRGAIELFDTASSDLENLQRETNQLIEVLGASQQTLRLTPHLLSWLLREYQFSEEPAEVEQELSLLGQTAASGWSFLLRLQQPGFELTVVPAEELELPDKLDALVQAVADYLNEKTDVNPTAVARNSSLTFRRNQIALRLPILSDDQRERLHTNVAGYLNSESATEMMTSQSSPSAERSTQKAAKAFLESAGSSETAVWESLLATDLPYDLLSLFPNSSEPKPASASDAMAMLWDAELRLRVYANSLGNVPSLYPRTAARDVWPFAAATQRWRLAESQRIVWQSNRLSQAAWGQGIFAPNSAWSDFYFGRLANRYYSRIVAPELPSILDFHRQLVLEGSQTLDSRAQALNSIGLRFGAERQTVGDRDQIEAPVTVEFTPWQAVAAVYIGSLGRPDPWNRSQPSDRVWAVAMDTASGQDEVYKSFSTEYWQAGVPNGYLTVRGNAIRRPLDWRRPDSRFVELQFEKRLVRRAEIRAESSGEPPVLNVVVLMDCSDSMDLGVPALAEGGAPPATIKLLDQVKENLTRVLQELFDANQHREADVRVCSIPFGIAHFSQLEPALQGILSDRRKTAEFFQNDSEGHFYSTKSFRPLDDAWLRELERLVVNLRSQKDTPLYDAIREAVGQAKSLRRDGNAPTTTQIMVFTDGVHFVNSGSPYRNRTTWQQVKQDIDSLNARLSIFHYDHFEKWVLSQPAANQAQWRRVQEQGIRELRELAESSPAIDYVNSTDASLMVRKALESIPRTGVTVESEQHPEANPLPVESNRTGYLSEVPEELLPGRFKVTSTGSRGGAEQWVQLSGGESILLLLDSSSARQFDFPAFEPEDNRSGWLPITDKQIIGGGFSSNLWVKAISYRPLNFVWMFRNKDRGSFTSRPQFVVGLLTALGGSEQSEFLLADTDFEPNTHFPRLRFASVPWDSGSAQITLWLSDDQPTSIQRIAVQPTQAGSTELPMGTLEWKRSGGQLEVLVDYSKPSTEDRLVLLFPESSSTRRRFYVESGHEVHQVGFDERFVGKEIEIQWTTLGQLRSWAKAGQITQVVVDSIPTQAR